MESFSKTVQRAWEGSVDLPAMITANQLYFAFVDQAPDPSATGQEFMGDLLAAGATVLTEMQLTNASWTATGLDSTDSQLTIPDPGAGTQATHCVLYEKTGDNTTARLIATEDIADLTFDGEDDTLQLPSPILST